MKVLLISLNIRTQFRSHYPFGTGALSAFLKIHGHQTFMFHLDKASQLRKLPTILKEFSPQVAGISGSACQAEYFHPIIKTIKQWQNIPVILGGVHPTLNALDMIKMNGVDAICRGEGEHPFLDYLTKVEQNQPVFDIPNFVFEKDGELIENQSRSFIKDINALPFVDRDSIDFQRIIDLNNGHLVMLVGRGCAWNCAFCSNTEFKKYGSGTYARNRNVEHVIEELKYLSGRYRFKLLMFRDDTLTWNRNWILKFLEEYSRLFSYPFDILTRADCLDKEIMDALKNAGCRNIFMGLDSGSDYIRNDILNKYHSGEQVKEVAAYLNHIGIKAVISNMVGLPYETPEYFQKTISLNKEIHKNQIVFSHSFGMAPKIWVFNPFPGTKLYEICKKEKWLIKMPKKFKVYRETYIDMPLFPRKKVYKMFRSFRYLVYKDNYPFMAWIFRIYDSWLGQFLTDLVPDLWFGQVRLFFSKISYWLKPETVNKNTYSHVPETLNIDTLNFNNSKANYEKTILKSSSSNLSD